MSDNGDEPDRVLLEILAWAAMVVVGVLVLVLIMGYTYGL